MNLLSARYDSLRNQIFAELFLEQPSLILLPDHVLVCNLKFELGSEKSILFWEAKWSGVSYLRDIFLRLCAISYLKEIEVRGVGRWEEDSWDWGDLDLRIGLGRDSTILEQNLRELLCLVVPVKEQLDRVVWRLDFDMGYSTKTWYDLVAHRRESDVAEEGYSKVLGMIWKSEVP